ncbi:MAG: plasmid pRiA4b ORF-3 family protein [Proteobacteria bacterium]|nr:plasmid pRiA4b ORF-3 family protein [Pseudomonadota bacterium]MDA0952196.1 plasmid pRiA4b ORF-3 family protein [Pseudomonadota bacterium]
MTDETPAKIATLRIELLDTEPPVWREVEVPVAITLKQLHQIVQAAMGWHDAHLWQFTVGRQEYGPSTGGNLGWGPAPSVRADKVGLGEVLKPRKTTLEYIYDFGDTWEHRLVVTRIRDAVNGEAYPRYVAGQGNAPPEDCGGTPGFYEMLDARDDPGHPDHEDAVDWLGDYDPAAIDEAAIRLRLGRIAKRRKSHAAGT